LCKHKLATLCLLLLVICLLAVSSFVLLENGYTKAEDESQPPFLTQAPNIQYQNRTVYVSLYLIAIYSFDFKSGSYTYDFYLYFYWTDPNISASLVPQTEQLGSDWYLANGYPAYPGAKLLVASDYNSTVKYELYRVRADLVTPLEGLDYPFNKIQLPISIELLINSSQASFDWLQNQTGISPAFENVGWTTPTFELSTSTTQYPGGVNSPRADMFVIQNRNINGAIIGTILPPVIFCIVALVCYFLKMHDSSAFSLRVGVNTSMLITAVLFNISVQSNIPPITQVTFYDVFIVSVFSFLAISLVVTVAGYVDWVAKMDERRVSRINRWGLAVSVAIPVLLLFFWFVLG
jgi:hypothetical protein